MNYTLNQLHIFLKVAQTQSVTRAAEELHLTQPAVSIQLRNLQNQFEVPLTEVIGRKIYITEFGREIAEMAERVLQQVRDIDYKMLAYKGQLAGRLQLSIVSTGKYVMPYFLTDFMKQHPGVELNMDVTNKARVIDSLKNNEVDFALVSILPDELAINKVDLLDNQLFLVGNKDSTVSSGRDLAQFFQRVPLIFREPGSGTRQTMMRFVEKSRMTIGKKMELTSNEAVKQAVLAGLGLSIMPLIGIKKELASGEMKIIPIKGLPITTSWQLIWLKAKKHSPVAQSFLSFVEVHKEDIIKKYFSELDRRV
ncbi:MAG: LysR family transcriptional regulator [Imperialibacter sp.]|uniref:LysR family transcriptional regulator n=1 Tax=Imperialibacter sp. TaxID=2038411 RepID=UPI0030DAC369|tara:strand:+ start:1967 stop:2893 length:927 start_codon:yes stop_codon:yes gene_type:complete